MKKIIFCLLALCVQGLSIAQDVETKLSLGSRDPKPDYCEYSPLDGGLVMMGQMSLNSSRLIGITKYDSTFKRQWVRELIELNPRKQVEFMVVIGENILAFASEYFPKEKVIKTYFYKISLAGKTLASEELLAVYPNQIEQRVMLGYKMSPNKRKLLIYKNLENRRQNEQLLYYIFDETGSLYQNGELKFKYPDDKFNITDLQISNAGTFFVMSKFYEQSNVKTPKDYKFIMFRQKLGEISATEIPIEAGLKFISNLAFRIDRDENIYVAGFYSNKGVDRIIGTIFQKINADNEVETDVTQLFSEAFLAKFLTNSQIEKGKELTNFYMHNDPNDHGIILRSDGGVLLAAERFYITTQSFRDYYGIYTSRDIYHYDEIILTSISPEGKIEWQEMIDKTQTGEVKQMLSFANLVGESGIYIIYDYNPRRQDRSIYYHVVDLDGKITERKALLDNYQWSNEFYPSQAEQITNNEMLLKYFGNGGRNLEIWKIALR